MHAHTICTYDKNSRLKLTSIHSFTAQLFLESERSGSTSLHKCINDTNLSGINELFLLKLEADKMLMQAAQHDKAPDRNFNATKSFNDGLHPNRNTNGKRTILVKSWHLVHDCAT
jgi:hypothetical protein